jgi:hypothetical protein
MSADLKMKLKPPPPDPDWAADELNAALKRLLRNYGDDLSDLEVKDEPTVVAAYVTKAVVRAAPVGEDQMIADLVVCLSKIYPHNE